MYLKKVGITLSEQNQCDPGPSTTNAGFSKEEKTKNVELNVKKTGQNEIQKIHGKTTMQCQMIALMTRITTLMKVPIVMRVEAVICQA